MNVADYFQYGRIESVEARFVEIPYESSYNMSMYVILPDKVEADNSRLLRQLRPEILTRMLSNSTEKFVQLLLPKFKIETEVPLHKAFSRSCDWNCFPFNLKTNSSKISDTPRFHRVRQAKSKVVFEIDEEGLQTPISHGGLPGRNDRFKKNPQYFIDEDKFVMFAANRPFIAIVVSKGKVFIPIFYIDFTLSQFRVKTGRRRPTSP
ncbi:serine protease inhibitor 3/4-like [Venturia canescens]|uniref:serine protease inhibitor 3/4-like n=1 Tax=Venturia canescens TaxID=32260 RepID=UPI001C9D35BA|nr:serine protease inhibitor 3/4-like [Venturia canescens]